MFFRSLFCFLISFRKLLTCFSLLATQVYHDPPSRLQHRWHLWELRPLARWIRSHYHTINQEVFFSRLLIFPALDHGKGNMTTTRHIHIVRRHEVILEFFVREDSGGRGGIFSSFLLFFSQEKGCLH